MRHLRRKLLFITILLMVTGIVMIYSTSAIYAQERYGDAAFFLKRHLIYLGIGILLSLWVLSLDPQQIRRSIKPFLGLSLLLLVLVLVPGLGHRVSGASRATSRSTISVAMSGCRAAARVASRGCSSGSGL